MIYQYFTKRNSHAFIVVHVLFGNKPRMFTSQSKGKQQNIFSQNCSCENIFQKTWFALTCFVTIWKVIFKKLCKSNFKKDTQRGDWKRSVFFLNFEEVNFCALQTFLAFLTELPGINYTAQFSYCFNNYLPTFALFDLIWLLNLKKRSTIKTNFLWSTIETKSTRSQVEKDRFAELMVCREWKIIFWRKTFLCLCVQKKTFGKFWKYQYFFKKNLKWIQFSGAKSEYQFHGVCVRKNLWSDDWPTCVSIAFPPQQHSRCLRPTGRTASPGTSTCLLLHYSSHCYHLIDCLRHPSHCQ